RAGGEGHDDDERDDDDEVAALLFHAYKKRRERGSAVTARRKEGGEFVAGLWRRNDDGVPAESTRTDAAGRAPRRSATHASRVPLLRVAGFVIVATALALNNLYVSRTFILRDYLAVLEILGGYCAGSWIVLHFWYRSRLADRADLSWLFHLLDIVACAVVTYA